MHLCIRLLVTLRRRFACPLPCQGCAGSAALSCQKLNFFRMLCPCMSSLRLRAYTPASAPTAFSSLLPHRDRDLPPAMNGDARTAVIAFAFQLQLLSFYFKVLVSRRAPSSRILLCREFLPGILLTKASTGSCCI